MTDRVTRRSLAGAALLPASLALIEPAQAATAA